MSSINYRKWDIFINNNILNQKRKIYGYFECIIFNAVMIKQTLEFLNVNYQINYDNIKKYNSNIPETYYPQLIINRDGELYLKIYDELNLNLDLKLTIKNILKIIEYLSICLDISLICSKIIFYSDDNRKILIAVRKPFYRGFSFEIEERGIASEKLLNDFNYFKNSTDENLKAGIRHYITGMTLLSLEDQISGLIDAAFMQFYQGCEILCRDKKGNLENSKKYIAKLPIKDSRELQIIAHHVWRVRNKYFGHGDVEYNIKSNSNPEISFRVAAQVLVARYLCRRLIDAHSPSKKFFIRVMYLYLNDKPITFKGDINQLKDELRVEYDGREVIIYDKDGNKKEKYNIK